MATPFCSLSDWNSFACMHILENRQNPFANFYVGFRLPCLVYNNLPINPSLSAFFYDRHMDSTSKRPCPGLSRKSRLQLCCSIWMRPPIYSSQQADVTITTSGRVSIFLLPNSPQAHEMGPDAQIRRQSGWVSRAPGIVGVMSTSSAFTSLSGSREC